MSNDKPKVTAGYSAIQTKSNVPPAIEIKAVEDADIEDVTSGEDEQQSIEVDIDTGQIKERKEVEPAPKKKEVETDEENTSNKKKVNTKEESSPENKRPSRAKKRIKQLHTEKTELQQELERERQEKAALQAQLKDTSVTNKTAMKAALESKLESLRKQMQDAMTEGDAEESVRLNEEMINSKGQLNDITRELEAIEVQKDVPKEQPKKNQPDLSDVPEKALDWIDEHPQFKSDELFYVSAMTISHQLINEGFDDDSEEFYEELDSRLSPRFPEVFGIDQQNDVNYTEDNTEASDEDKDGNENTSQNDTSSKRQVEQTVSGASRTPPHQKGKKGRGNESLVLDPETVRQSERWGLSLEQVARRVAHNTKNKRDDGYTPILIKKS